MKKHTVTAVCATILLLSLTGCVDKAEKVSSDDKPVVAVQKPDTESVKEDKPAAEESFDKKDNSIDISDDKKANVPFLDASSFEEYDRQYIQGETYNPVFENRCFYVNGVRVHMPNTVGDLENLFHTHFVDALHMVGNARVLLITEHDEGIVIEYDKRELPDESFHSFAGDFSPEYEESLRKLMDTHIVTLVTRGERDTHGANGVDYPDILKKYNVTFEDVDDSMNDFGYRLHIDPTLDDPYLLYKYLDEELYVFYKLLKGEIPAGVEVSANIPFEVYREDDFTFIGGYEFGINDYMSEDGTCYLYAKNTDDGSEVAYDYDFQNRRLIEVDASLASTYTEKYDDVLEKLSSVDQYSYLDKITGK